MRKIALELQPCVKQRSGIGVYTYELAKRLKNDENLNFYGTVFNFLGRNDISGDLTDISFNILTNRLMPYGIYRRTWNYIPCPYNRMFNKNAQIYHFFNYIVPPNIKGKVITTIHDIAYLLYPETMDPKNLKRINDGIDYSIQRSDMIIAVSEYTKKMILEKYNIPDNKVEVVYNSFSVSDKYTEYPDLKDKYSIDNPYILYVGNLEPRKNIPRLIKAFSKLKKENKISHSLVIVGQKSWLFDEIFKTLEDEGISDQVLFTGFVDNMDKTSFYRHADLFIYPSLYEGFGIPILEAMAMGTPVVCSDSSSMPEVGGDAAFYIDPLDIESIANGIETVLGNEDLKKSMIEKGYEQIKKFSWDESAEKLKTLYKTI